MRAKRSGLKKSICLLPKRDGKSRSCRGGGKPLIAIVRPYLFVAVEHQSLGMATHNVSIEKTCHWVLLLSTIIVAAAGLSACNTDPDRHEELGRVGWTLEEGAITLGEDLFLVGTDDFYFGRISDLDVNEEGRMYVGDSRDLRVKVLTSDGEFLRSIGRRGEGPEEFRSIFDVTVGRGDSLYVVDGEARRLSVYDQEGEFQYARSIDSDYGVPYKVLVPEQREGFLVAYTPSFCHSPEETDMHLSLRRVGPKGEVGGAVLEAPCKEKISRATDGAIQVLQKPFGRQPLIASAATESFFLRLDGQFSGISLRL